MRTIPTYSLVGLLLTAGTVVGLHSEGELVVGAPRSVPEAIVGPQGCAECHEAEFGAWNASGHHERSATLTRHPETRKIAKALGIRRVKSDARCTSCHFTLQASEPGDASAIAGVSCESCHGPARGWLELHDDFGGAELRRGDETAEHREQRLSACAETGMRHPDALAQLARACYECHAIHDPELLAAGHPTGEGFEFLSWSQGEVRHNFVRGAGANEPAPLERRRVMFVVGQLLELEFALRAMHAGHAGAPERLARAGAAVARLHENAQLAELRSALEAVPTPSDGVPWLEAAGVVGHLAERVVAAHDGADLAALDALLPPEAAYVGAVPR